MIEDARARSDRPFNVNSFVHALAPSDAAREAAWLDALGPVFKSFGAASPAALRSIYNSLVEDEDMLAMRIDLAPW